MKIIKPSVTIENKQAPQQILKKIEREGRVCYKSEDHINTLSAIKFVEASSNVGMSLYWSTHRFRFGLSAIVVSHMRLSGTGLRHSARNLHGTVTTHWENSDRR